MNGLENQLDSFCNYCINQFVLCLWCPEQLFLHRKCREESIELESFDKGEEPVIVGSRNPLDDD